MVTGASDAQYHVMWISLFNALDEYGIRDDSLSPNEVQDVKQKVFEEALHASLRVSALVSMLNPPYLPVIVIGICIGGCINIQWILGRRSSGRRVTFSNQLRIARNSIRPSCMLASSKPAHFWPALDVLRCTIVSRVFSNIATHTKRHGIKQTRSSAIMIRRC